MTDLFIPLAVVYIVITVALYVSIIAMRPQGGPIEWWLIPFWPIVLSAIIAVRIVSFVILALYPKEKL